MDSGLCITSRLSSRSFTVCRTGAPALALHRLVAYLGTFGNDVHATCMRMHQSVSLWSRPGALCVSKLPACASGAHSRKVGNRWLSCVEVAWGNWPRASCLFSLPSFASMVLKMAPASPFLLHAFSSQRLRLFIWDFSVYRPGQTWISLSSMVFSVVSVTSVSFGFRRFGVTMPCL